MVFLSEEEYRDVTDSVIVSSRDELARALLDRDDASGMVIELSNELSDVSDDFNSLVRDHERTVEELTTKTREYDELYKRTKDTLSAIESSVKEIRRDM